MNKLRAYFQRKRQERLIKNLYKETAFWTIYSLVAENDVNSIQRLKQMKSEVVGDVPLGAFEKYLNYRIAIYLKHMNYAKSADTQENRSKLIECLDIRDELQRVQKTNKLLS